MNPYEVGNRLVISTGYRILNITGKREAYSATYSTRQIFSILVPPGEPMGSPQVMA